MIHETFEKIQWKLNGKTMVIEMTVTHVKPVVVVLSKLENVCRIVSIIFMQGQSSYKIWLYDD